MPTTIDSAGITFNDATSLTSATIPANAVGATQIANGSVTAAKLGTNEQKQIAKAWVNFNGVNTLFTSQSYSQTGNVLTIGTSGFGTGGLYIGQKAVIASVASGSLSVGTIITVTAINSGTGVVTFNSPVSLTSSGTCSWNSNMIRSGYNVSSVTKNGTGDYTVNFTTAMADANYVVTAMGGGGSATATSAAFAFRFMSASINNANIITSFGSGGTSYDSPLTSVQIFGN